MSKREKWTSYKGDVLAKPENVKGYSKLSEECKKLFAAFLENFYKAWEYPEEHMPTKVCFKKDRSNSGYLRVDFKDMWLHVKGPNVWY